MNAPEYAPDKDAGLFGCSPPPEARKVTVIGVPWEPTASYGRGCSGTPKAIVPASHQLDLFEPFLERDFGEEVALVPLDGNWDEINSRCIRLAEPILERGGRLDDELAGGLEEINRASVELNHALETQANRLLADDQVVGVLGGDHASPLGSIRAHARHFPNMGILHIDAHHDLRQAYEGFEYSHASIMFNVLEQVRFQGPLVSVGIRDFSSDEWRLAQHNPKVITHYDRDLNAQQLSGEPWSETVARILAPLPEQVYVSFDIDGLDPKLCPNTGTPVPGGLQFQQATYLLECIAKSGRRLVGFDLCEVAPGQNDWDLNVGARILHKLAAVSMYGR